MFTLNSAKKVLYFGFSWSNHTYPFTFKLITEFVFTLSFSIPAYCNLIPHVWTLKKRTSTWQVPDSGKSAGYEVCFWPLKPTEWFYCWSEFTDSNHDEAFTRCWGAEVEVAEGRLTVRRSRCCRSRSSRRSSRNIKCSKGGKCVKTMRVKFKGSR